MSSPSVASDPFQAQTLHDPLQFVLSESFKLKRKIIQDIFTLKVSAADFSLAAIYASILNPSCKYDPTDILANLPPRITFPAIPDSVSETEQKQPEDIQAPEYNQAEHDHLVYTLFKNTEVYKSSSLHKKLALWIFSYGVSPYSYLSAGCFTLTGRRIHCLEGSIIPVRFFTENVVHSLLTGLYNFSHDKEFSAEVADYLAQASSTFFSAYAAVDKKDLDIALEKYIENYNRYLSSDLKISEKIVFTNFFNHLVTSSVKQRTSWEFLQSENYQNRIVKAIVKVIRFVLDFFDHLLHRLILWGLKQYGPGILQTSLETFRKKLQDPNFQLKILKDCKNAFKDLREQSQQAKNSDALNTITTKNIQHLENLTTIRLARTAEDFSTILLNGGEYKPASQNFLDKFNEARPEADQGEVPPSQGFFRTLFSAARTPTKTAKSLAKRVAAKAITYFPNVAKRVAGLQDPKKDSLKRFLHPSLVANVDILANQEEFLKMFSTLLKCSLANFPLDREAKAIPPNSTDATINSHEDNETLFNQAREDALFTFLQFIEDYTEYPVIDILKSDTEGKTFMEALNEFSQDFCRLLFQEESFIQMLSFLFMKTFNDYAKREKDARRSLRHTNTTTDLVDRLRAALARNDQLEAENIKQITNEHMKNTPSLI